MDNKRGRGMQAAVLDCGERTGLVVTVFGDICIENDPGVMEIVVVLEGENRERFWKDRMGDLTRRGR